MEKKIEWLKKNADLKGKIDNAFISQMDMITTKAHLKKFDNNEKGIQLASDELSKNLAILSVSLEKKWFKWGSRKKEVLQWELVSFFYEKWYIFAPWITPISPSNVWISLSLYKIIESKEENLSNFTLFWEVTKTVEIYDVETEIKSHQQNQGFINDWLTLLDWEWESKVMIFPKNLKTIAKQQGSTNMEEYRKMVEINELSQAYFSSIFPNKLLRLPLNKIMPWANPDWTIFNVLEAYSDYETLRQWALFTEELSRIKNSQIHWYSYSKAIAIGAIELHEKEWWDLKEIVIESYKANILMIMKPLQEILIKGNN